ncbi:MAG: chorismate synthase [Anaerovoracaceae bacterium]
MSSTFGRSVKVTVFGESHAGAIGVTIDGLPAGMEIDMDELQAFLDRRAPGRDKYSTARKEADRPEFLCGVLGGRTCGTPVTAVIRNTDTRSGDYAGLSDTPRPGHADFTGHVKYAGFEDVRGGGHFSGRLTAPICIAGGIMIQELKRRGITIKARAAEIAGIKIDSDEDMQRALDAISNAREDMDSVGGIVECVVEGVPAGMGDPMFDGVENVIAQAVFGVPAVKGVEFGAGFEAARMKGSENNDSFMYDEDGRIVTKTNNAGGSLGGITTGMPIVFRAALKPTPSIAREQDTVNYFEKKNVKLSIKGRHDPCVALRAVPVLEAAAAMAVFDLIQSDVVALG